jgi:hypothetical protein
LDGEDYGDPLLEEKLYLMEIKVIDSIPLWLVEFLGKEKIYSQSFSKYGREFQKYCWNMGQVPQPQAVYCMPFQNAYAGRTIKC